MNSLARTRLTGLIATLLLLGPALQDSDARGRGGGGFSRGGVAASGAFSARVSAPGHAATRPEISRPTPPPSAEQRPPRERPPPTSQRLPGGYPPPGSQQPPEGRPPPLPPPHDHDIDWDDDWDHSDAAAGFVVGAAAGALVNEALQPDVQFTEVTALTTSAPAPVAVTSLPCSPASSLVGGVTYYRCGSTYYVQAYAQGGLLYVPVAPP